MAMSKFYLSEFFLFASTLCSVIAFCFFFFFFYLFSVCDRALFSSFSIKSCWSWTLLHFSFFFFFRQFFSDFFRSQQDHNMRTAAKSVCLPD